MLNRQLCLITYFLLLHHYCLSYFTYDDGQYPTHIKYYPIRFDRHANKTVSRNRIKSIGGYSTGEGKKVSYKEFRRLLQCAKGEPGLDKLNLYRILPITRRTLELVAMYFDTGCSLWKDCHDRLQNSSYVGSIHRITDPDEPNYFVRIHGGKVIYDWPSFPPHIKSIPHDHCSTIDVVLSKVSDIGDSVFFFYKPHGEVSSLPELFPVPSVCQSIQKYTVGEVPWPWEAHLRYALQTSDAGDGNGFIVKKAWKKKVSKAVLLGAMSPARLPGFLFAASRRDLFTTGWYATNTAREEEFKPLNPNSLEESKMLKHKRNDDGREWIEFPRRKHSGTGYLISLEKTQILNRSVPMSWEYDHSHKYIVVMVGSHGMADSDRLARLLCESGAVILLQDNEYESYFSKRLIPWVHYVPLLHSMIDVVAKVEWLREHDDLAMQILINARNFCRSYLRLEDILCYSAAFLKELGDIYNNSASASALIPFSDIDMIR